MTRPCASSASTARYGSSVATCKVVSNLDVDIKCQASGDCKQTCSTSGDCVDGYICDATTKVCVATNGSADSGDNGGCGCRATGSAPRGSAWGLIALALAAGLARRRKRA